jgi:heat shock protein HslJ
MKVSQILNVPVMMIAVLLIMSSGCKKDKDKQDKDLINTKWTLEYLQNSGTKVRNYFPATEQKKISIIFTDSLNTMLFSGICNDGSATYSYTQGTGELSIHDLKLTLILCSNVTWENNTAQYLLNAQRYEIKNDSLTIASKSGYDLHFSKK